MGAILKPIVNAMFFWCMPTTQCKEPPTSWWCQSRCVYRIVNENYTRTKVMQT